MTADGVQSVSLSYYAQVLRQRAWLVVLCTLLGAAVAAAALALIPVRATATAAVSADVISADPFNPSRSASGLIDPAGEALVADSFTVASRAAEQLGGSHTPQELREATEVTVVADTTVLRIAVTAESAERARTMADALAQAYLDHRSQQAQERIDRTLERVNTRLSTLRDDLTEVDTVLRGAEEGSPERAQAETDRSLLDLEINAVLAEAASAQNIDTTGGSILSPAASNPIDYFPPPVPVLVTGTLAGLGLGVLLAFLLNALNTRVRGPREVQEAGGRKVLAHLSERHATTPASGQDLEDFRTLRERILLSEELMTARTGVLAVLDESTGRSGEDVAVNLAVVLASSGIEVEYLRLGSSTDELSTLADALALVERPDPGDGRRFDSATVPHLTVYVPPVPTSTIVDEPLSGSVRHELTERQRDVMVVVHAPGGVTQATRLAVGRICDTAVLVASRGRTRIAALQRAAQDLAETRTPMLGTVLVPPHRDSSPADRTARYADAARSHRAQRPSVSSPARDHQPSGVDR